MKNLGAAMAGGGGNRRKDDFYPTPPEATAALLLEVTFPEVIWEPACGDGAMVNVMEAFGYSVYASDLVDRGCGASIDFLDSVDRRGYGEAIVTNPPFTLAEKFIRRALSLTPIVAMLLKANYANAACRIPLFEEHPPSRVLPLSWRLDFTGGGNPTMDCTWFVWGVDGTPFKALPKPWQGEWMK